jgi:uncharacterized SAM-binding protein YcdF (DUF218 family)
MCRSGQQVGHEDTKTPRLVVKWRLSASVAVPQLLPLRLERGERRALFMGMSPETQNGQPGTPPLQRRALGGLVNRKERWSLSVRGWLFLIVALLLLAGVTLSGVHPFLAITHRQNTDILVVEGWVHDYAIRAAVEEFKAGSYLRVFTTGGPVTGLGHYVNDYQTAASVAAGRLKAAGIPSEVLQMAPSRIMDRDRTYSSAIALREWFREHNFAVRKLNIVTEGLHARRSRLLFQKAFGDEVEIGIIAIPSPDYEASRWWRYSEGVKEVISETAAYLYVRFLFSPPAPKTPQ